MVLSWISFLFTGGSDEMNVYAVVYKGNSLVVGVYEDFTACLAEMAPQETGMEKER